jgi:hypothetical protein
MRRVRLNNFSNLTNMRKSKDEEESFLASKYVPQIPMRQCNCFFDGAPTII